MDGQAVCEKKQSVADEIMEKLDLLRGIASTTAERVESKLTPVMRQDTPEPETACVGKGVREYPHLFTEMRDHLENIEGAFDRIANALDRTEL